MEKRDALSPANLRAYGASISRPGSVLSVAETITTTTSIADFEDGLSDVTTPRGGSPNHFAHDVNPELPPSYDESEVSIYRTSLVQILSKMAIFQELPISDVY